MDKTWERLSALCGRLSSDHEGERAIASAMATRHLRAMGLTWNELIERAAQEPQKIEEPIVQAPTRSYSRGYAPKPRSKEHEGVHVDDLMQAFDQYADLLSPFGQTFVSSLKAQRATRYGLTKRQWTTAFSVAADMRARWDEAS